MGRSFGGSPSSLSSLSSGLGGSPGRSPVPLIYSRPGELRSLAVVLASSVSEAARSLRGECNLCALMDSAPEPIGLKTDEALAKVPKVVLHRTGVRDDHACALNWVLWEFHVVHTCVRVMLDWVRVIRDG